MKNLFLLAVCFLVLVSCQEKSNLIAKKLPVDIIPKPKLVENMGNTLAVKKKNFGITCSDIELLAILDIFRGELRALSDYNPTVLPNMPDASIIFKIDDTYAKDEYRIEVEENILVKVGSYQAAAMARITLLQMVVVEDNTLFFPEVRLHDNPDAKYRGLMIDLARNWHSMENVKKLIDLASYYKVNYVQLHFTDDQSYTLPSLKYPQLSTPERHYSFDNLKELERYSQMRGVTIVPEIDIPGHAKSLVTAYPELFGIAAYEENPYIINMGKEEVYEALNNIFSEIIPIFKSSPYFHIGGDEARFTKVMEDPHVKTYMKSNNLGNTDVHELYRHFLVRVNDMVKKHRKQTCIWEGFAREGQIEIPKDVIVFEFESLYHLPNELIENGYTLVNASWKPLYVVNEKKWEPKTIYDWNMWRFENWWSKSPATANPIQLEETPLIIGAQMCTWEQPQEIEFISLRKRLPVMIERIWNSKSTMPYDDFMKHLDATDQKLSTLTRDSSQDPILIGHNHEEPTK